MASSPTKLPSHCDADHKSKAEHDKETAQTLLSGDKFPDWVITCSFYFALHCVDTYAHRHGVQDFKPRPNEKISPHKKRELYVWNVLRSYFNSYKRLLDVSIQARYDPQYFTLVNKYAPKIPKKLFKEAESFMKLL